MDDHATHEITCSHCTTDLTVPHVAGVHTCPVCGFDLVIGWTKDGLVVRKPHEAGAFDGLPPVSTVSLGVLEVAP